jgi:hypothetical protein
MNQTISRLNCSNCRYFSSQKEPVTDSDLNVQGGIKDRTPDESKKAKEIKLITLPGKMKVDFKHWCNSTDVDQWVTEHMWCRAWEAPGTIHIK